MRDGLVGCLAVVGVIIAIILLALGGLILGGVIKIGNTIIDREVVVNSQQYITSVNTSLLNYQTDYNSTNDPARQASIVSQFCGQAAKIKVDQITPQAYTFYVIHCH